MTYGPLKSGRGAGLAACLIAVAAVLAGCGSSASSNNSSPSSTAGVSSSTSTSGGGSTSTGSSTSTSSSGSSAPVHIAFLNESLTSYTIPMTDAMKSTAAAHDATVKMFNANNDPSTQLSQCQSAIASGQYQAIVDYPVDGAAAVPCAKQALAAHLTFIPVDSPVGANALSTSVQVPGIKAQVLGAAIGVDANLTIDLVKKACSHFPKPCTIVQTESIPAFFYCSYKVKYEQPALEKLGYKVLATLVIGNFDDEAGMKSAILTELAKQPHFDVLLSDDDSSVQGAVELKAEGKLPGTLIIGDGGSTAAIAAIKAGTEFGTAYSVPRTESSQAVMDAIALVHGQTVTPVTQTQLTLTKTPIVTKANIAGVTAEW